MINKAKFIQQPCDIGQIIFNNMSKYINTEINPMEFDEDFISLKRIVRIISVTLHHNSRIK